MEATADWIGNKIANKTTRASKAPPQNSLETNEKRLTEKYISSELGQKKIDDLRLRLK